MRPSKLNLLLGRDRRLALGNRSSPGESASAGAVQTSKRSSSFACYSSRVRKLCAEAIEHHALCESARKAVVIAQQRALWHGWQAGIQLNQIKAMVGVRGLGDMVGIQLLQAVAHRAKHGLHLHEDRQR